MSLSEDITGGSLSWADTEPDWVRAPIRNPKIKHLGIFQC
jgi:hypothetical protein